MDSAAGGKKLSTLPSFSVGDRVRINTNVSRLKEQQSRIGEWTASIERVYTNLGVFDFFISLNIRMIHTGDW